MLMRRKGGWDKWWEQRPNLPSHCIALHCAQNALHNKVHRIARQRDFTYLIALKCIGTYFVLQHRFLWKVDFPWIAAKIVHCKSRAVPWTDDPWMERGSLLGKVHWFISLNCTHCRAQNHCIVDWYSAVRWSFGQMTPVWTKRARACQIYSIFPKISLEVVFVFFDNWVCLSSTLLLFFDNFGLVNR